MSNSYTQSGIVDKIAVTVERHGDDGKPNPRHMDAYLNEKLSDFLHRLNLGPDEIAHWTGEELRIEKDGNKTLAQLHMASGALIHVSNKKKGLAGGLLRWTGR